MRDAKTRFQRRIHLFGQQGDRNGRGIGGEDRTVLEHRLKPLVERPLDIEPFDNGLDHEIAIAGLGKVILDIADLDALDISGLHQQRRIGFGNALDRAFDHRIATAFGRGNVEQHDIKTGIGRLGGNARTHGAGADHADFFNRGNDVGHVGMFFQLNCRGGRQGSRAAPQ